MNRILSELVGVVGFCVGRVQPVTWDVAWLPATRNIHYQFIQNENGRRADAIGSCGNCAMCKSSR